MPHHDRMKDNAMHHQVSFGREVAEDDKIITGSRSDEVWILKTKASTV